MNEILEWMVATGCGGLLAIFYFGGLWWTIRGLPTSPHPLATYFGSLVIRLAVALLALFCLMLSFPWQTLAASLCGFMIVRLLLLRRLGHKPSPLVVRARSDQ